MTMQILRATEKLLQFHDSNLGLSGKPVTPTPELDHRAANKRLQQIGPMIRSKYRELDLLREMVNKLRHRVYHDRDSGADNDFIKIK
jgi:hypothetical protein